MYRHLRLAQLALLRGATVAHETARLTQADSEARGRARVREEERVVHRRLARAAAHAEPLPTRLLPPKRLDKRVQRQ